MLEVDDKIAFVELAEINLRAIASFRAMQTSPAMDGKTPEQFVRRENDEVSSGKTKTAAQRSFEQIDFSQCVGRYDLAKTLDLALGLKIDRTGCLFVAPSLQPRDELRALRFHEHEIANGEFADVAFDKCAGKIFRLVTIAFDPALANLDVSWRGELRRARRRGSSALQCGFEFYHEAILSDVITDATADIVSRAQKHARLFARADGSLSIEVEFTQRFNFVPVEFNPQRQGSLPGKNIDNTAADRELTPGCDLGDAFIACAG